MKIKALESWPPQDWRSNAQTLAPEDALDAQDVSASVELNQPGVITLSVTHNDQRYGALLSLPPSLANKIALIISGASPSKPLREIGELEIDSELSQ